MSDTRRLQVLRAIVEDYVHTREPVGSKALVERHNLEVSPATIRNDMAFLEEEGLIVAPHTSAGRIPTDRGYRTFVDKITEVRPLSTAERRAMDTLLETADDHDAMLEQTVRLLAMLTNQVAVLQHPQQSQAKIRHIEVVSMTPEARPRRKRWCWSSSPPGRWSSGWSPSPTRWTRRASSASASGWPRSSTIAQPQPPRCRWTT